MRGFLLILLMLFLFSQTVTANEQKQKIEQNNNQNQLVFLSLSQELSNLKSETAVLGEKLEQQKSVNEDVQKLEETYKLLERQIQDYKQLLNQKEQIFETKFIGQKELFEEKLTGQFKSIENINNRINDLNSNLALFGTVITLLALLIGFSARNRAINEAKIAANLAADRHMEQWLENNKEKLLSNAKIKLSDVNEVLSRVKILEQEENKRIKLRRLKDELSDFSMKDGDAPNFSEINNAALTPEDWLHIAREFLDSKQAFHSLFILDSMLGFYTLEDNEFLLKVLFSKARSQTVSDDSLGAIETYDKMLTIIEEENESEDLKLLEARVLFNKAGRYRSLDDFHKVTELINEIHTRFKDSDDKNILQVVKQALGNKNVYLIDQSRFEEQVDNHRLLIDLLKCEGSDYLSLFNAYDSYSFSLNQLSRFDESIKVIEKIFELYGKTNEIDEINERLSAVLLLQYDNWCKLKDLKKAIANLNLLQEIHHASSNENVKKIVAFAFSYKAKCWDDLNEPDKALGELSELISKFNDTNDDEILLLICKAYSNKIKILFQQSNYTEVISVSSEYLTRFAHTDTEEVKELISKTTYIIGLAYSSLNEYEEALEVVDRGIRYFENKNDDKNQSLLYVNLGIKLRVLSKQKKDREIIEITSKIISNHSESDKEDININLAGFMFYKAVSHSNLDEKSEAINELTYLLQNFNKGTDEKMIEILDRAEEFRGSLLEVQVE